MPRIIFTHGGGRFANQLMAFAHLIALAEEHEDLAIVNASFWRFADLCAGTEHNPMCIYPEPEVPPEGLWMPRLARKCAKTLPNPFVRAARHYIPKIVHKLSFGRSLQWFEKEELRLGSDEFLSRARKHDSLMLSGWKLRDWGLFEKHQEEIRPFLRPAERFEHIAEAFVADLKRRYSPIVGVMVRQTDYRLWENGRFFLSSEQYRALLERLSARFGASAAYILAADEPQPASMLDGLNAFWCTGAAGQSGHYMESFAELARADVVVSVPSTFAAWAAFFGGKPLLPVAGPDADIAQVPLVSSALIEGHRHPILSVAVN